MEARKPEKGEERVLPAPVAAAPALLLPWSAASSFCRHVHSMLPSTSSTRSSPGGVSPQWAECLACGAAPLSTSFLEASSLCWLSLGRFMPLSVPTSTFASWFFLLFQLPTHVHPVLGSESLPLKFPAQCLFLWLNLDGHKGAEYFTQGHTARKQRGRSYTQAFLRA